MEFAWSLVSISVLSTAKEARVGFWRVSLEVRRKDLTDWGVCPEMLGRGREKLEAKLSSGRLTLRFWKVRDSIISMYLVSVKLLAKVFISQSFGSMIRRE